MAHLPWKKVLRQVDRLYTDGTSTGCTDSQLLSRFAGARDESELAFETIVQRHGPMVLEVCRRLLKGDHHAAEDAFQATFLVLARRAETVALRPSGSLGPWLHEVACRTATKARVASFRRATREQHAVAQLNADLVAGYAVTDDDEDYRVLHEEVARLPAKYRSAVVLCYFEGLTHDEAARSLHWPVGTVRGYLSRARDLLRVRLIRRGVAPVAATAIVGAGLVSAAAAMTPELIRTVGNTVLRGPATAVIARLASSTGRSLVLVRLHSATAAVCLIPVAVAIGGLAISYLRNPGHLQEAAQQPAVSSLRVDPESGTLATSSARTDVFGDPLPVGWFARFGTVRLNHGTKIKQVEYSPDGRFLASRGNDGTVRLWNPGTGREVRRIGRSSDNVVDMSFEPGAKMMSLGVRPRSDWDDSDEPVQTVQIDFNSGVESARTPPMKEKLSVPVDAEGQIPAVPLPDACLEPKLVARDEVRPGPPTPLAASRPSSQEEPLRKGETSKDAAFEFSVRSALQQAQVAIPVQDDDAKCEANSPDGRWRAVSAGSSIQLFDRKSGQERWKAVTRVPPNLLKFSVDGSMLASSGENLGESDTNGSGHAGLKLAPISLWNVKAGRLIREIPGHVESVQDVSFSPDGKSLASCGLHENVIRIWNVADGKELLSGDVHSASITAIAVSADGALFVTGDWIGTIRAWDRITGHRSRVIGRHAGVVTNLVFSPDCKKVISCGSDSTCRLWDIASSKEVGRYAVNELWLSHLAVSSNGKRLIAGRNLFDVNTEELLANFPVVRDGMTIQDSGTPMYFMTDDRILFTHGRDVEVRDASGRQVLGEIKGPLKEVGCQIAVSVGGRWLAASNDETIAGARDRHYVIRLWETASGREVGQLDGHSIPFDTLAFSHDGRWLATGESSDALATDESCYIRIWDLARLVPRQKLAGHRANISNVVFSPNNRWLASASSDATVLIWDVGEKLRTPLTAASSSFDQERSWSDLVTDDASKAYRAIWDLALAPETSIPFLSERLKPIEADDPQKDKSLSPIVSGETLRRVRAIAVLEIARTPEARRLLERLAAGLESARDTHEARASLRRLGPM